MRLKTLNSSIDGVVPLKRTYDIRIRNAIATSRNPNLFPELNVPRSTALQWIREGYKVVVTHPEFDHSLERLTIENTVLRNKCEADKAKVGLVKSSLSVLGFQMQYVRVASSELKEKLLLAIKEANIHVPLQECLQMIGLTSARYHSWVKRQIKCSLGDLSSCPRLSPSKITRTEINTIKDFVTAKEFSHFSISSLAWFAKREGNVFASASTWYRIVRDHKLRRSGERIYPPKSKIGIRASLPNQIWHLDMSVFRIMSGPKVYIQAIIDNASRFVLAWEVSTTYGGASTKKLIEQAFETAKKLSKITFTPNLFVDSGTENLNREVNLLVSQKKIIRTISE